MCFFINKRIFLCTLCRLIFIDLQNVGVISAAPCIQISCYHAISSSFAFNPPLRLTKLLVHKQTSPLYFSGPNAYLLPQSPSHIPINHIQYELRPKRIHRMGLFSSSRSLALDIECSLQALSNLHGSYVPEGPAQVEFCGSRN